MADEVKHSSLRGNCEAKSNASSSRNDTPNRQQSHILSREEEYKRLNAELEKKTASLVQEAEMVMRGQENALSKSKYLDNISTEDFLNELDADDVNQTDRRILNKDARSSSKFSSQPPSGRQSAVSRKQKTRPSSKADNVAVPDETFMTSLYQEFNDMSTRLNNDTEDQLKEDESDNDDVLPQMASNMGSEASIRFLKAKLRVMQEELDRLAHENHKKDEDNKSFTQKLKEIEEERNRLLRTSSSQQQQIDKHKKIADDARDKAESLEGQLTAIKKELDQLKRNQKQHQTTQSATEVRLNRALEDIEKYREQLQRIKSSSKDSSQADKQRLEQLLTQNKRLEKQKSELMAGFRKQMKLIDILKRQKMHIEAAKMMQFSEEEFVKALEWGS